MTSSNFVNLNSRKRTGNGFVAKLGALGTLFHGALAGGPVPVAMLTIKAKEQAVSTIELTPAGGVDEFDPDFDYIRSLVDASLHPPTPTPTPEG